MLPETISHETVGPNSITVRHCNGSSQYESNGVLRGRKQQNFWVRAQGKDIGRPSGQVDNEVLSFGVYP